MGSNALEQLKRETKDDAKLYSCIKELYEQGVPFSELKVLIPGYPQDKGAITYQANAREQQ